MSLGPTQRRSILMPHNERRKLIDAPFIVNYVPGKSWGGVNLGNAGTLPEEGRRTWTVSPADESYLRYGRSDMEVE